MSQQVEYRYLGKSGLRVSLPILGGMPFGNQTWNPTFVLPEDKGLELLKAAWDRGINTIDAANMYSNGDGERMIAKFMKQYNIPRKNMVIIDKVAFLVDHEEPSTITSVARLGLRNTRDYVNQGGLSRGAIFNQVEDSLARLETDYIDILQIHFPDADTPFEETMRALHDLVLAGKVRYLGASNFHAWQFIEMNSIAERNGWTPFMSIQVEHSVLYRAEESEMFAYCNYKGIGIMSYAPLMSGKLARPVDVTSARAKAYEGSFFDKKVRDSDVEIINRVQQIAAKRSWTMSQVALAWSLTKVSSPIVGVNSLERLDAAITTGKTLTPDEIKSLEELYVPQPYRF